MKKCPFCKNEIMDDAGTCPMCQMTLIEKLPQRPPQAKEAPKQKPPKQTGYQYYPPNPQPTQRQSSKGSNRNRSILISIGLSILVSVLLSSGRSLTSRPTQPLPPPVADSMSSTEAQANTAPPNVLATGTVLTKNRSYFSGNGTLLIKNGSGSDAVIELVPGTYGKSVYTVYVRTGANYMIPDIKDGTYKLLFTFGSDWNSEKGMFNRDQRSQMFDEGFDFTTTSYDDDEYTHVKYSTYTITLNPVIGGKATTTPIDQDLFNKY